MEHREQLEKLGFVFGEEIDDVFVEVALPDGWTKEPTDHNMWSDLLDEQGRKRAGIFYKAAFYDRSGHMDWHSRYSIRLILADGSDPYRTEPDEHGFHRHVLNDNEEIDIHAAVIDGNAEIHRTEPLRATIRDYDVEGKLRDSACEWLDANRPNWSDPFLSWDN